MGVTAGHLSITREIKVVVTVYITTWLTFTLKSVPVVLVLEMTHAGEVARVVEAVGVGVTRRQQAFVCVYTAT